MFEGQFDWIKWVLILLFVAGYIVKIIVENFVKPLARTQQSRPVRPAQGVEPQQEARDLLADFRGASDRVEEPSVEREPSPRRPREEPAPRPQRSPTQRSRQPRPRERAHEPARTPHARVEPKPAEARSRNVHEYLELLAREGGEPPTAHAEVERRRAPGRLQAPQASRAGAQGAPHILGMSLSDAMVAAVVLGLPRAKQPRGPLRRREPEGKRA